jgi:hypothetical protein
VDEKKAFQIEAEIWESVKKKIAASNGKLGAGAAFSQVVLENPDLVRRREDAMFETASETARRRAVAQASGEYVQTMIDPVIREKIAASEGRLDYGQAYKAVLNERPDLAHKVCEAIRLFD